MYNNASIKGIISSPITFSHKLKELEFYTFSVKVKRKSEVYDTIPILITKDLLESSSFKFSKDEHINKYISIEGEFRSFDLKVNNKTKLLLFVYAKEIKETNNLEFENTLVLDGYICKNPIFRITPLGKSVCDILIASNRKYNKSDYLPAIAWGKNAYELKEKTISNYIHINGRIQSREYIKTVDNEEIKNTAYEISIMNIKDTNPIMLDDNINKIANLNY